MPCALPHGPWFKDEAERDAFLRAEMEEMERRMIYKLCKKCGESKPLNAMGYCATCRP